MILPCEHPAGGPAFRVFCEGWGCSFEAKGRMAHSSLSFGHVAQPFAFFAKAGAVPLQSKTSLASRPKQNFNRSYTYNSLNHIQSMSAPGRVAQAFAFFAKAGDVHSSHQIVVHWRNVSPCLGDESAISKFGSYTSSHS